MKTQFKHARMLAGLLGLVVLAAGCGGGGGGLAQTATATVMLAANSNAANAPVAGVLVAEDLSRMPTRSPVDVADIDSLWVTITKITLDRVGNPDGHGEDDDDETGEGHDGIDNDDDGETDEEDESDADATVEVSNSAFTSDSVDIEVGDSVTWVWTEDGSHTVTSGAAGDASAGDLFDAPGELTDDFFVHTFQIAGTYPYHSSVQADVDADMTGVVIVGPDSSGAPPKIVIFQGSLRVNLLDLLPVSDVLSVATIPPGKYNGIRLTIESPELFLAADPATAITDIHVTANGRLFIKEKFEVEADENILIIIDFGSIHLVLTGNGSYVLTPQLRVILDVVEAEVEIEGIILAVDDTEETILIELNEGGEVLVNTSPSTTYSFSDATGATFGDLEVGQEVEVEGTLKLDGTLDADTVEIELEEEPVI